MYADGATQGVNLGCLGGSDASLILQNYLGGNAIQLTTFGGPQMFWKGSLIINSTGQFVGPGIVMYGNGITANGFNPYVGGVQYTGATLSEIAFKDSLGGNCTLNGSSVRMQFYGGVFVGLN
jgi:hypothetical protein